MISAYAFALSMTPAHRPSTSSPCTTNAETPSCSWRCLASSATASRIAAFNVSVSWTAWAAASIEAESVASGAIKPATSITLVHTSRA